MSQLQIQGENLLTVQEATVYMRISRVSLYRHRRSGKIKSLSAGGKILFSKADIQKFLESGNKENQASNG